MSPLCWTSPEARGKGHSLAVQPEEDCRGAVPREERDQVIREWLWWQLAAREEVLGSQDCHHSGQEGGMAGRTHAGECNILTLSVGFNHSLVSIFLRSIPEEFTCCAKYHLIAVITK